MIYLTLPELLHVAGRLLGPDVAVRDYGLLGAALARPQATAFGKDAYPSVGAKAAALLHSLARNHALIDGNKRLALAAVIAFYGINGRRLTLTNDQAYDLIMKVAAGELDQVEEIAAILQVATRPRPLPAATARRRSNANASDRTGLDPGQRGPQGQALLAEATRATSGDTPGHVGYDACLAIDYLDFTTPARRTR